ncbi:unnamed protein product [Rodentolepis nana]|uniref:Tctex1 domain-containing protein 2 n=1 Tax=Rodentolepis nana TaxID=102285 RepID=A0A0R3TPY0_RODNA|nr:unnamed protein product [Rodentolepis nana]
MTDLTLDHKTVNEDRFKSGINEKENCDQKIKPDFSNKFRTSKVREIMREILKQSLDSVKYDYDQMPEMTKMISNKIRDELRNQLNYKSYSFLVQVIIGEQKGQGVKAACRCFWDNDTDSYAENNLKVWIPWILKNISFFMMNFLILKSPRNLSHSSDINGSPSPDENCGTRLD